MYKTVPAASLNRSIFQKKTIKKEIKRLLDTQTHPDKLGAASINPSNNFSHGRSYMALLKNIFYLLLFTFFSVSAETTIKEKHLHQYVVNCLEYWFYPNHTNPDLKHLAQSITHEIKKSESYDYAWSWSSLQYEATYRLDYVEQMIRGAIIQYITESSYTYAREITNRETARSIADYIHNYLFNYCAQMSGLSQGVFSGCIGTNLKKWVHALYDQTIQDSYVVAPQQYYSSLSCCICLEDFSTVPRVYLKPCGHDICINCGERWFFTENKNSCPLCRQTVDKKALRIAINQSVYNTAKLTSYAF